MWLTKSKFLAICSFIGEVAGALSRPCAQVTWRIEEAFLAPNPPDAWLSFLPFA